MRLSPGASLTESTYQTIRAEIVAGRLRPEKRLKVQELCTDLGVSPGAVREALARLLPEGLVVAEAQKGFSVAPVCLEDLDDLARTRSQIEGLCLRQSIARGNLEWETRVVAATHRLSRLSIPQEPDNLSDEWATAHADFHLALVAACDSPWLLKLRQILFAQSERYSRVSLAPALGRDIDAEHQALSQATLSRDTARACHLLTEHLLLTAKLVRVLMESTAASSASGVSEQRGARPSDAGKAASTASLHAEP